MPNVVFETTSLSTRRKDTHDKPDIYSSIGINEYFVFDLEGDYLDPQLQAYRLVGGKYERLTPDPSGLLTSQELGMRLVVEDGELQFYDLLTGQRLLTSIEMRDREARRAEEEAAARQAAEAEITRLREELARKNS